MPSVIAAILIIALVAERGLAEWLHARERRYLINATIADTPGELKALERKPEKRKTVEPIDGYEGQIGL